MLFPVLEEKLLTFPHSPQCGLCAVYVNFAMLTYYLSVFNLLFFLNHKEPLNCILGVFVWAMYAVFDCNPRLLCSSILAQQILFFKVQFNGSFIINQNF